MLTKTDFLHYLETPLHLWAERHNRLEVQAPTPFQQRLFQQGQQVEDLAHEFLSTRGEGSELQRQVRLVDGQFEAWLDYLLYDSEAGVYDLYEVKSGTSLNKEHEYDLAFQALVCSANLPMRDYYLVLVNREYVRYGAIDRRQFFKLEKLNEKLKILREEVLVRRQHALETAQQKEPDGLQGCSAPDSCPCPTLCHPDLPQYPIYDLPRLGKKALELKAMGVTAIEDIPDAFPLSDTQRAYAELVMGGRPQIDIPGIRQQLAELEYPLYFLDYETVNPALPLFDGYHPYDLVVFQYSLHMLERPDAELQHYECLVLEADNPAPKLVNALVNVLGPHGSVMVWNRSFEERCNRTMAQQAPEYTDFLEGVNARLFDLMNIFSKHYYLHPDFHGSTSLKRVLPVLAPDLDYNQLEIQDGEQAMQAWWEVVFGELLPSKRFQKERALLAYCKQDTLAMVAIWRELAGL